MLGQKKKKKSVFQLPCLADIVTLVSTEELTIPMAINQGMLTQAIHTHTHTHTHTYSLNPNVRSVLKKD